MLRVAVDTILAGDGYVVILAPTRDLIRQHVTYFTERLAGTGLGVGQIHGGAAPADRRDAEEGLRDGRVRVVVGSAMLLTIDRYWDMIDALGSRLHRRRQRVRRARTSALARRHRRADALRDRDAQRAAQLPDARRCVQPRRADAQDAVQRAADQGPQGRGRVGRTAARAALARRRAHPRPPRPRVAHLRHRAHARRRPAPRPTARRNLRHRRAATARRHGRYDRTVEAQPPQRRQGQRHRHARAR